MKLGQVLNPQGYFSLLKNRTKIQCLKKEKKKGEGETERGGQGKKESGRQDF